MAVKKKENVGAGCLVSALSTPLTVALNGLVLAKLWEWFVADTFGIKTISTAEAIGLAMVVKFITYQWDAVSKTDDESDLLVVAFQGLFMSVAMSIFAIFFGLIIKSFI